MTKENYLRNIKAILIVATGCKMNLKLSNDWLVFKEDGLSPKQAIEADFEHKLPRFSWWKVAVVSRFLRMKNI